jgi:3-oxoacyl-[acyl-carrier protein] reductase
MPLQLAGKTALITGGSRGIGAAIAQRLAANGAVVAFSYGTSPDKAALVVKAIEDEGGRALALQADQADTGAAMNLISTAYERLGRLDILVNNAGVTVQGKIDDPDADQAALDRQFAINVTSVAAAVRVAAKLLSDGGRIISIGSVFGARSPWTGISGYSATKAALGGYTRGWARDLGPAALPSTSCSLAPSILI